MSLTDHKHLIQSLTSTTALEANMTDNQKFIAGLVIIAGMVALGFVLVASYFDVLVK
jgi:hypothetical protein